MHHIVWRIFKPSAYNSNQQLFSKCFNSLRGWWFNSQRMQESPLTSMSLPFSKTLSVTSLPSLPYLTKTIFSNTFQNVEIYINYIFEPTLTSITLGRDVALNRNNFRYKPMFIFTFVPSTKTIGNTCFCFQNWIHLPSHL